MFDERIEFRLIIAGGLLGLAFDIVAVLALTLWVVPKLEFQNALIRAPETAEIAKSDPDNNPIGCFPVPYTLDPDVAAEDPWPDEWFGHGDPPDAGADPD